MTRKKKGKGGYGDPPREHCFKKGQSGNPKGRPKGSRNFQTILNRELERSVKVTDNGVRRSFTKSELMVRVLTDKAIKGDIRAFQNVQRMIAEAEQGDRGQGVATGGPDSSELSDEVYQATLEALLNRAREKKS